MTDDENPGGSENTPQKRVIGRPFQPGNPGKPKGAKHKLQEDFFKDVRDAWEARGKQAIVEMISEKPSEFVKMVAGLMPKEATLTIDDHSEMTDDELAERVRNLAAQLAPFLTGGTGDAEGGVGQSERKALPSRVH